jgi:hypothetical protein
MQPRASQLVQAAQQEATGSPGRVVREAASQAEARARAKGISFSGAAPAKGETTMHVAGAGVVGVAWNGMGLKALGRAAQLPPLKTRHVEAAAAAVRQAALAMIVPARHRKGEIHTTIPTSAIHTCERVWSRAVAPWHACRRDSYPQNTPAHRPDCAPNQYHRPGGLIPAIAYIDPPSPAHRSSHTHPSPPRLLSDSGTPPFPVLLNGSVWFICGGDRRATWTRQEEIGRGSSGTVYMAIEGPMGESGGAAPVEVRGGIGVGVGQGSRICEGEGEKSGLEATLDSGVGFGAAAAGVRRIAAKRMFASDEEDVAAIDRVRQSRLPHAFAHPVGESQRQRASRLH